MIAKKPTLTEHEINLVAFGRFMVNADPYDARNVDPGTRDD